MKPVINILDTVTVNKVAAGEVIERPSFVIKELVENSIDAKASAIITEIREGGLKLIKVVDNGIGIPGDQITKAFMKNATSKITCAEDIVEADSYGFRGEALASISAVSHMDMTTKYIEEDVGTLVEFNSGKLINNKSIGCNIGTTVNVRDLFFNVPARLKFMKRTSTEASYCGEIITRLAIANPQISFKYINNDKTIFHTPGNSRMLDTIKSIYSYDIERELIPIAFEGTGVRITGFAGKPSLCRSDRKNMMYFINSRYIKLSPVINSAISRAYSTLTMVNKYPFVILKIDVDRSLVDVNVHPAKLEVRFSNDSLIYEWVYDSVKKALDEEQSGKIRGLYKAEGQEGDKGVEQIARQDIEKGRENHSDEELLHSIKQSDLQTELFKMNNDFSNFKDEAQSQVIERENSLKINSRDNIDSEQIVMKSVVEDYNINQRIKYIGQLFSTYLIVEQEDKFFLIDQHAVHERLNYDMLMGRLGNAKVEEQLLLKPEIILLDNEEYSTAFDNKELLNSLGYDFDDFGDMNIAVRSVPNIVIEVSHKELFMDLLHRIKTSKVNSLYEIKSEAVAGMACKMSIKANKVMSDMEVRALFNDMKAMEKATCPHGRPLFVEITKREIEKMFKRIQ